MSIIEAIKNGAKFRHKEYGLPVNNAFDEKCGMYVTWTDCPRYCYYSSDFNNFSEDIELIPEEEELWVAVGKRSYVFYYGTSNAYTKKEDLINHADCLHGPDNYTIHKITRTK